MEIQVASNTTLQQKDLKEVILNFYLKEISEADHICPVTYNDFSVENPPYKLEGCSHRLSRDGFGLLPIHTHNKFFGTAYQICPICRSKFHFAVLDLAYLTLINFGRDVLGENEFANVTEVIAGLKVRNTIITKDFPKLLEPKGGILGYLNYLASKSA